MKEEQNIYIRGSKDRPDDVRKILEQHGGRVRKEINFTYENCIYYIGYDGIVHYISEIDYIPEISQLYKMIKTYYHEVKLPSNLEDWKTGDILVSDSNPNEFYVFDKFTENGNILVYLTIDFNAKIEYGCHIIFNPKCHKVNSEELKKFYALLASINTGWDAYNKKLTKDKQFFYPKNGHYYTFENTIKCKNITTGEWYNAVLYNDANGQYVRELNDFNTKFKKV